MKRLGIALTLLLALPCQATVFLCEVDGVKTYSDKPCAVDAAEIQVETQNVVKNTNVESNKKWADKRQEVANYIHNDNVDMQVKKLEAKIKKASKKRDRKIRELRQNGRYANNNLAGATWQASLAQQMQAVTQQTDTEVRLYQEQINRLLDSKN